MEDLADLAGGLAAFDLHHKPTADASRQSELILRQALTLPFAPNLPAKALRVFDVATLWHRLFPNGNISADPGAKEANVPERDQAAFKKA